MKSIALQVAFGLENSIVGRHCRQMALNGPFHPNASRRIAAVAWEWSSMSCECRCLVIDLNEAPHLYLIAFEEE